MATGAVGVGRDPGARVAAAWPREHQRPRCWPWRCRGRHGGVDRDGLPHGSDRLRDRPAAVMVSDLATASPAPTRPTSSPARKPCARNAGSVHPGFAAPEAARRLGPGSTRSPPLHPRQRLPRRLPAPVRPGVRADDAAARRARGSRQFGRASAPTMPQRVQTMRCGHDGRSAPPHDGTASTTPRSTARPWRACCPGSLAGQPEIVVVYSSGRIPRIGGHPDAGAGLMSTAGDYRHR
jgi:hypothetical protein